MRATCPACLILLVLSFYNIFPSSSFRRRRGKCYLLRRRVTLSGVGWPANMKTVFSESVFTLHTGITCSTFKRLAININSLEHIPPIPVAARSMAWVYGRSLLGVVGSNPAGAMDLSPVSVACRQVEVSATGWSLVQRFPTDCGVSECDIEISTVRRTWPPRDVVP